MGLFHAYIYRWGTRPHLGATRPRVSIANLGLDAPSWQYSCINITQKGRLQQNGIGPIFFERLEFLSDTNNIQTFFLTLPRNLF